MAANNPRTRMCHYEVLGVEMDCDVDAVRKSYKRAALQWHPDKNMDQIDLATEKFRLISEAYQVLSDPKERSWYDTHRESILRGGDGTAHPGMNDDSYFVPDLWKFFTPTRTSEDFYRQFQQAFDGIIEAERADLERQSVNEDKGKRASGIDYPTFGMSQTSFDEVKRFYSFWENFSSKMSFSWKDKFDTRETENRFQRRHVEKLNETERTAHRKEYNNLVRSLAAYCQKRDERYLQGMRELEAKQQEKRDKQLAWDRERKEAKQRQKEEIARMRHEEAQAERALRGDDDVGEEEDEVVVVRAVWNCGVCSKEFKSEKQLHNHEGSKKHKDAVKQFLKKGGSLPPMQQEDDEDDLVELVGKVHITKEEAQDGEQEVVEAEEEVVVEAEEEDVVEQDDDDAEAIEEEEEESAQANSSPAGKKIGKAKLKRLAKQKKAETAAKANKASSPADAVHACGLCFEEFPSKTKLFEHIKQMDHALPMDEVVTNKASSKSSKRKQGK